MKKTISIIIVLLAIGTAIWGKSYYNDRYVHDEYVYAQVPLEANNTKTEWLKNADGKKVQKGKEYQLTGYTKEGEEREVLFTIPGTAKNYYAPGTYLKISMSKTIVLGQQVVEKDKVPDKALKQLNQ